MAKNTGWVTYTNGNYKVRLNLNTGTKIRYNKEDKLIPEYPESIDLCITKCCNKGCQFCYINAKPNGPHADLENVPFLDTLLPYTELAISGGNPLEHPGFADFLQKCKDRNIICNTTLNQDHFMSNLDVVNDLIDKKLIYGIGVSLTDPSPEFIKTIKKYKNAVVHVIAGVHSLTEIQKLADHKIKMLILGYKTIGRGVTYKQEHSQIAHDIDKLKEALPVLAQHFTLISFDNLALKQLNCKTLMSEEEWNQYYMGKDGEYSMYIDLVAKTFSKNSLQLTMIPMLDDIKLMFTAVKPSEAESDI